MYSRPDKPLVVKCTFDRYNKRITFSSARNCTYALLRHKVEQCFSLSASAYAIAYKDDDGEVTDITTDDDLSEAIQYFHGGNDDAAMSSAASILSGRSFGSRKITLRVHITVDYDGPSLSDTGSLASLDEYQDRNGSSLSFSLGAPSVDLDDDSVTVSSRDASALSVQEPVTARRSPYGSQLTGESSYAGRSGETSWAGVSHPTSYTTDPRSRVPSSRGGGSSMDPFSDNHRESGSINSVHYPEDPSAVFERLKLEEALKDDSSSVNYNPVTSDDRGLAWLKDQNERVIRSKLGTLPEPDIGGDQSSVSLQLEEEDQLGDLALQRDTRGKYYYSYNSAGSSSVSQTHDSASNIDETQNFEVDPSIQGGVGGKPRPTSRQLNWLAAQQKAVSQKRSQQSLALTHHSNPSNPSIDTIIPPELLPFIEISPPPQDILTDCSKCGVLLDNMRYVCSTCGAKEPVSEHFKGKAKVLPISTDHSFTYPPERRVYSSIMSPTFSSSSRTFVGSVISDSESISSPISVSGGSSNGRLRKPLPSIPIPEGSQTSLFVPSHKHSIKNKMAGYELCAMCIESAGVDHAIEAGLAPGSSPTTGNYSPSSPEDAQRVSQWRRAAPRQKGQLRHAYLEKIWTHTGWADVEQDESTTANCSGCSVSVILRKAYKCTSCIKYYLCRACYSQVHDVHPSHAFLVMPEKRAHSDPEIYANIPPEPGSEQSMVHPGVKCAHCLLDIVGARFHCAICESVDICSNCESAGLPGNLHSDDGGHAPSHILIKIPFPLQNNEVQNVSRKAVHLWTRDPANINGAGPGCKAETEYSEYTRTVVGGGLSHPLEPNDDAHNMLCNGCDKPIRGVRFQCGSCPSLPASYNLCSSCEELSYKLHDPTHIFFKLPRPVDQRIADSRPLLPKLYKTPAGPSHSHLGLTSPTDYLKTLFHSSAICDRCMTPIQGVWFRCAYCGSDLCDACEEVDTHNDTHIFIVFKSVVDMQVFKVWAELDHENPAGSSPVIPYPVYR
ncbi:hypothetical protein K435DRAFT_758000 [Dendrothele bispora CBS 962.96]|uniref:ZZ-type domain-containing protein n=1 Tax=Dendrothele bispora (strain CBS 962.96) TaxID=1314807 RepID=A0A4V4HEY3_DENBC|nr:hypothetical protein K435DRAFT_758000 [Dendrothele bispora CBS 962.96]